MFTDKFDYLYVEPSTHCSLGCPRCPRTYAKSKYRLQHLDPLLLEKVVSSESFSKLKTIEFGGNFGDPIFHPELNKLIQITRKAHPQASQIIHTSGNRNPNWWKSFITNLSKKDYVLFSVDGLEDTNGLYRINSNWNWIYQAMSICSDVTNVIWKFIIFKHNQGEIFTAINMAKDLQLKSFILTKSTLFNGEWLQDGIDPLAPEPGWIFDSVDSHSILNPKCKTNSMHYLSAEGVYSPCCWMDFSKEYSVPLHSILSNDTVFEEILRLDTFNQLEKSWTTNPCQVCSKKCSSPVHSDVRSSHTRLEIDLSLPISQISRLVLEFKNL